MINEYNARKYCYEIEKVENYDKAITDTEHKWECHHRLEIGSTGEVISMNDLKRYGLYYNRPASELIFLTHNEHRTLHKKGKKPYTMTDDIRRKMSGARKAYKARNKSKPLSQETKKKISESKKGKKPYTMTDETRKKISEIRKAYWAKKKAGE